MLLRGLQVTLSMQEIQRIRGDISGGKHSDPSGAMRATTRRRQIWR